MLLEIAANAAMAIAIFLAGRNSVHSWWLGIVGCALFGIVFYETKLYADVILQAFFIVTNAVGWYQWLHGDAGRPLVVRRASRLLVVLAAVGGTIAAIGYGALLHAFTDAYAPFVDSTVLAFSVIAQVLLMQRRVATWPFWLLVNSIAIPLYASRELYLTAVLSAVYWVNAVVAWRYWRQQLRAAQVGP
jgi:nicotinamide mononucleotide transporter